MSKVIPKIWALFPVLIQTSYVTMSKALHLLSAASVSPFKKKVSFSFSSVPCLESIFVETAAVYCLWTLQQDAFIGVSALLELYR